MVTKHARAALAATVLGAVALTGTVAAPAHAGGCGAAPTTTKIRLTSPTDVYGSTPDFVVRVTGDPTPTGSVVLTFDGDYAGEFDLTDGRVRLPLPLMEHVDRSYGISAWYQADCGWAASDTRSDFTQSQAGVDVTPAVVNARKAKLAAVFTGSGGLAPGTGFYDADDKAKLKVVKISTGRVVRAATVDVDNGAASYDGADLRPGRYRLVVKYVETERYAGATGRTEFRVR